jgi:hypothetical protein
MTCRHPESLLEDYLDGELSPADSAALKKHLQQCDYCRAEYESARRLKYLLADSPLRKPGSEYFREVQSLILAKTVDAGLLGTVGSDAALETAQRISFVRSLAAVAASLAIFFTALYIGSSQPTTMSDIPGLYRAPNASAESEPGAAAVTDLGMTSTEHQRITGGLLLVGPPGLLGRFAGAAAVLGIEPRKE